MAAPEAADPVSVRSGRVREAEWSGDPERLDRVLPQLDLVRSRSRATELIAGGRVTVDGALAQKPGARVATGSRVSVAGEDHYVGRAAHKLLAALDAFAIDPAGRTALDLGASTGGFTQVLLERGAATVLAIDVGHDQLARVLREDARVRLVEGCNARDLTADTLAADTGIAEPPSLVVADLSFISLRLVLPAIAASAAPACDAVLLVKPQFEVGRVKDGVVVDPEQWATAIRTVIDAAHAAGFETRGIVVSPISGGTGNREFLAHFARGDEPHPREWESRIAELIAAPAPRMHADETRSDEGR